MRWFMLLVAALGAAGCSADCGTPQPFLDGRTFDVFGNVMVYEVGQTGAPPGNIPVNGSTTWEFAWGSANTGPVTVVVDGQSFEGEGSWNEVECNNFSLQFGGVFTAEDDSTHNFNLAGNIFVYEAFFEGAVAYTETWTSADGIAVGQLSVSDGSVAGELVGQ